MQSQMLEMSQSNNCDAAKMFQKPVLPELPKIDDLPDMPQRLAPPPEI